MLAWLLQRLRRPPVPLTLYTREGCGLCDDMKEEIGRARLGRRTTIEECDIASDVGLEARWGRSIPVLFIGGRLAFKGHMTAGEFTTKFARLAAEWDRAQVFASALDELRRTRRAAADRDSGASAQSEVGASVQASEER